MKLLYIDDIYACSRETPHGAYPPYFKSAENMCGGDRLE